MKSPLWLISVVSALLLSAPASAQNYWFLKSVPSLKANGGGTATPVAESITLAAAVLPEGMDGKPYSFDIKTLTQVTGGTGISEAQFTVGSGTLPAGIALSNEGLLAGTPTAVTAPEGASFTVAGTYLTASGQQAYTIKVGELVLQVSKISAGRSHTCAITLAGAAVCWGYGELGTLGDGLMAYTSTPVTAVPSGVTDISAGSDSSCAVVSGAALCWGSGGYGLLGNGSTDNSNVPVQVTGLGSGVQSVSVGGAFACAIHFGGVKCWGRNNVSQLGDGSIVDSSIPVQVAGLTSGTTDISLAGAFACAIHAGSAKCWGDGNAVALGNGELGLQAIPIIVSGLGAGVKKIAAGAQHLCAINSSGAALCWGNAANGRLGNNVTTGTFTTPVQVSGLVSGVREISLGSAHTCAINDVGAALCWGNGGFGRLGNGSVAQSAVPSQVTGVTSGATSITAFSDFTCAAVNGAAKCWGANAFGQLGAATAGQKTIPTNVRPPL